MHPYFFSVVLFFFLVLQIPSLTISFVWITFFSQFKGGSAGNKSFEFAFENVFISLLKNDSTRYQQWLAFPWALDNVPLPSAFRGFELVFLGNVPGNRSFLSGCFRDFPFIFSFQEFTRMCLGLGFWSLSCLEFVGVHRTTPRFSNFLGGHTRFSI